MAPDRVGQQLGNYRLTHVLGWGGFAEVYLGEHLRLGTRAAIKVLHAHITGTEEDNFLAEARTIAHLEHAHIIRILDFDVQHGVPFLVMGYAPNGSLRSRYPKGTRLPLPTVLAYVQQVAAALQYAHDHKVIHRDIKPENMLIGRDDEIFLSDFGIALIAQSSRVQHIQSVVGTAIYMAPEQLQGMPRIASDQYALAVVVYEWLTGERPFRGTFLELYSQHLTASPPSMHAIVPTLPPQLDHVIQTAMAKDPAQRFENVKAFAAALEQAAHAPTLVARPTARLEVHTPLPDTPITPVVLKSNAPLAPLPQAHVPIAPVPIAPVPSNMSASLASPAPIVVTPPRPVPIGTRLLSVSVSPSRSVSQPLSAQPSSTPSSALSEALQPAARPQAQISRRTALTGIATLLAGGAGWWLSAHQGQLPMEHSLFKAGAGRSIKSNRPAQNSSITVPIASTLARDTFQRGDQLFWGTASDGSLWEGDANTAQAFSIANATGRIAAARGTFNALLGPVSSDIEIIASVSIDAFANGVNCGLVLRWFNDDNWYKALLDGQHLSILRRINGQTDTLKTIPFPMQAKRFYKLRFRTIGVVLLAKAWPIASKVEPPRWQITASDTTLMSGRAGIRAAIQPTTVITITSFMAATAAIDTDSTE